MADATIQFLLETLLSQSKQEISLIWNLEEDIDKLHNSLLLTQSFISSAENQLDTNPAVKRWLEQLEGLAFEADAVLDEFDYKLLRKKVMKEDQEQKKVIFSCCFNSFASCSLFSRSKTAHKIKNVNDELESINKKAESFGLQKEVVDARNHRNVGGSIMSSTQKTDSFADEPSFVGRENEVSEIVNKLVNAPIEETISIFSIVGMGGLGKTTLARKVFHHEKIKAHFEKQIWVCVSTDLVADSLFKMILQSLTGGGIFMQATDISREVVLKNINNKLAGKRYLLVLDDVWNEEPNKWNDFINSLSGTTSLKGNAILVTTRKQNVSSLVNKLPRHAHQLQGLSKDECWSIIKSEALSSADDSSEFKEIGEAIAEKCGGLPLMAKVLGGLLRRDQSVSYWHSILNDQLLHSRLDDGGVVKILKLSYDFLPWSSLKKCFSYCAIFPQDSLIEKKKLIELWMAEGFLQDEQINDMYIVGNKYFNYLLQCSLFQEAGRDRHGNISHCNMHDLVHDVASSVSGSRSIILKDGVSGNMKQVRYVYLKSLKDVETKYWRTVWFDGCAADFTFSGFKCLHSLIVIGTDIEELSIEIGELIHLRFLDVSRTKVTSLPTSIGKLYHLQTLRTPRNDFKKLPEKIIDLIHLRHLQIPPIQLPNGIGKLSSLQILPHFQVGKEEEGCKIGELGKLKNLRGDVTIQNLEMVHNLEEAKQADLNGKSNIMDLSLKWDKSREGEVANDKDVLEGLQPHPKLKSLVLYGYRGKNFRVWRREKMSSSIHNEIQGGYWVGLNNLTSVRLKYCNGCEEVPMLGHLPCLKNVEMRHLLNVRSIGVGFYGPQGTKTPFPALEELVLTKMENLREWADFEIATATCPRLESLQLYGCPELKRVSCYFSRFKKLKISSMGTKLSLTNICSRVTYLEELSIDSVPGLTHLPDQFFVNNQNLTSVSIERCPKLTHLVSRLGGGAALRKLVIMKCGNFRELPDDLNSALQSLEVLKIWKCGKLNTISLSIIQSLLKLHIYGCYESSWISLSTFQSLQKLGISHCRKLKSISLSTLPSLQELEIRNCEELESISYSNEQSQGLSSLQQLTISNCQKLTDLPCRQLFEWCSSSLVELRLLGLKNLVNLTTGDFYHPLRKSCLRFLEIVGLPPKLMINFPLEINCSSTLKELEIGGFENSLDSDSINEFLRAIFSEYQSLQKLKLSKQENWDYLPDQIQHLTHLEKLLIINVAIEALPEWLGNMSSLRTLRISYCKKLLHMPSKEAMRRLTKLDELEFYGCPLIKERYTSGEQMAAAENYDRFKINIH